MLSETKKKGLLATTTGGDISPLARDFISLVLSKSRDSTIQFMAASYITLYRKQKNITRGWLITAVPVTP